MEITILDGGVVLIAAVLVARGIWVGFVRQLAFFLALTLGYGAAGQYYGQLSHFLVPFISNPQLSFLVTYLSLFVTVYLLAMTGGAILRKVMQISFLGWFDRLLGGIFGLAKAVFVCTLLFMMLAALMSISTPLIQKSYAAPYLMSSSQVVVGLIRDKNMQLELLPKQHAISSFFSDSIPLLQTLRGGAKKIGKEDGQVPEGGLNYSKLLPAAGGGEHRQ